jgi:hypothetical protein
VVTESDGFWVTFKNGALADQFGTICSIEENVAGANDQLFQTLSGWRDAADFLPVQLAVSGDIIHANLNYPIRNVFAAREAGSCVT